jgi:DNA-binding PadR family transcriptional regulator
MGLTCELPTRFLTTQGEDPERWSHGYDLCRSLDLKPGTVYPILMRLAERGLLVTAWEEDPPRGRPARHLYRVTPDGAEYARESRLEAAARAAGRGASADAGIVGAAILEVVR